MDIQRAVLSFLFCSLVPAFSAEPQSLLLETRERLIHELGKPLSDGRYKDYADHGRRKEMELGTPEFVRRFSLHVLPKGLQKIRHFGLLSNRNRKEKVAAARALLDKARPDVVPASTACILPVLLLGGMLEPLVHLPPRCPCCGSERVIHLGEKPRRILPVRLPFPDTS